MTWISIPTLPPENTWVIGLIDLTPSILLDHNPVIFQVKYTTNAGWSDWCGDRESDEQWRVIAWMPIPKMETV